MTIRQPRLPLTYIDARMHTCTFFCRMHGIVDAADAPASRRVSAALSAILSSPHHEWRGYGSPQSVSVTTSSFTSKHRPSPTNRASKVTSIRIGPAKQPGKSAASCRPFTDGRTRGPFLTTPSVRPNKTKAPERSLSVVCDCTFCSPFRAKHTLTHIHTHTKTQEMSVHLRNIHEGQ